MNKFNWISVNWIDCSSADLEQQPGEDFPSHLIAKITDEHSRSASLHAQSIT